MINPGNRRSYMPVLLLYWVCVFVLYLPAAKAGRVGDFPGWVDFLHSVSFWDYINRSSSGIPSMYQFTQIVTLFFYQFFKGDAWGWHILYVTLQAINALLVFVFFGRLFSAAAVRFGNMIAFAGALTFCLCPHISETVVWEPAFHYLLGLMLMLLVLLCTQSYIATGRSRQAWWCGIVFLLSTFSLEIFYLTPLFTLSLTLYLYSIDHCDKQRLRSTLLYVILPQVLMFLFNQWLVHIVYHQGVAHIGIVSLIFSNSNLSKPLKYLFHILFMGRYFPTELREKVYAVLQSGTALIAFYGSLSLLLILSAGRYMKMSGRGKAIVLLFLWLLFSLGLIAPLSFPATGVSILDRYTYQTDAFIYVFLFLLLGTVMNRYVLIAAIAVYGLVNIRYTHRINAYWQQSSAIVNNLVETFPNDPAKKVLLLNLPECFQGMQMVGSRDDGEFRMMYNAIKSTKLPNTVHDVEAFYVSSPMDGAHVIVHNDTSMVVTLNQWGTWWLYYGFGALSYENSDYKVNMADPGHWYELTLKHPSKEYLILFQAGGNWRKVDMNNINVDQY